jgi:hypothetical protein
MPLTPFQQLTYRAVYNAVPELPKVIAELVTEYTGDRYFELIETLFEIRNLVSERGFSYAVKSPDMVTKAIQYCLVSPICSPSIKRHIFVDNGVKAFFLHTWRYWQFTNVMNEIFNRIRVSGQKINLNFVNLSFCNLDGMDLRGMTALKADFTGVSLFRSNLRDSNLTGSRLTGTDFRCSDLRHSVLRHTTQSETNFSGVKLDWSDFTGAWLRHVKLAGSIGLTSAKGLITDDKNLQKILQEHTSTSLGIYSTTVISRATYVSSAPKKRLGMTASESDKAGGKSRDGCIVS